MDCYFNVQDDESSSLTAYKLLYNALSLIPISHYLFAFAIISCAFLYNFVELHFFEDLTTGFRGTAVGLTYNSASHIYDGVVSKCQILRGRFLPTPWLSSPHLQTCFLQFFARPPTCSYRRKLFHASDGGTIALDWLMSADVSGHPLDMNAAISKDDTTPLVIVVPGLTSHSACTYIKHLTYNTAKQGWNVVVSNHRGLGGVSITSDCFYNAGWTEDTREVINYLHHEYPKAPLFVVGTSIGANILVKYLGEEGEKVPVAGAVAICSPWDLLIGDRFICRKLVQKCYDRALTVGLQGYAQLHEPQYTRLANWEGIKKSRSIRDFDNYATCLVGKFETVDTYYRRCSSSPYVGNVSVPLLCISALDDPLCTMEAIPWDECRANKNIVLATTKHGGHLAFFEGLTASSMWWVRAVNEFLGALHSSPYMHVQTQMQNPAPHLSESSFDHGPYVNVTQDGLVAAVANEQRINNLAENSTEWRKNDREITKEVVPDTKLDDCLTQQKSDSVRDVHASEQSSRTNSLSVSASFRRCLNQISLRGRGSIWLLACIAIMTSWPSVGSALKFVFRKKPRNAKPTAFTK